MYEEDLWSARHTGYIHIPEDGVYYFRTDGEFWLNDELFISNEKDNQGTARRFSRSDKSVALAKGYHRFELLQLGAIFGGWPTQWDNVMLSIRKEGEAKFRLLKEEDFK